MELLETKEQVERKSASSGDADARDRGIEVGDIGLHRRVAEEVEFTDVYNAIRRHQAGEVQDGLPPSLRDEAEADSKSTGLVVSYHCARTGLVFGVVTNQVVKATFVRLAPLPDLEELASLAEVE